MSETSITTMGLSGTKSIDFEDVEYAYVERGSKVGVKMTGATELRLRRRNSLMRPYFKISLRSIKDCDVLLGKLGNLIEFKTTD